MAATKYIVARSTSPEGLAEEVNKLLPDYQPLGSMTADDTRAMFCQAMVDAGGVVITDGMTIEVEPTGEFTEAVTFDVENGEITGIVLS